MWWDIMVSALILLVLRWYILERAEMWTRSKENCSSDATSVYVCEWNKEFSENTTIKECIIEWVINRATASLSLLNRSGSVAMDRYQWLSNTCACHYMYAFTAFHTQMHKSTEQGQQEWHNNLCNSQRSLLSQCVNQWLVLRMNCIRHHSCFWM